MTRQVAASSGAKSAMRPATSTIIAQAMTIAIYRCNENAA
jgi:hypothetical protein